jgi:hypothetical protein
MANEAFDPKAANQEFRVIRKRTRELERGMALHLRGRLRAVAMALSDARDAEITLAEIREFLDDNAD